MESKAEQFYPTYKYLNRDILLLEFDEAQKIANGQSKVYGQVANLLLAIVTVTFTVLFDDNFDIGNNRIHFFSEYPMISCFLFFFGLLLLRYFVDLQKQITINARKVVTLRTLLGVDYGSIQLTLPNWRVEGANNPFAIKYFHGWTRFRSMPFWLITIAMNAVWWATAKNQQLVLSLGGQIVNVPEYFGYIVITAVYLSSFRRSLNDRHETVYLNFVQVLARVLRVRLLDNFEYVIYRAKLAFLELDRLKVKTDNLSRILIQVEDRFFDSHPGVSLRALVRGILSRSSLFRMRRGILQNGGSTITMQLTRTLFIPADQNKYTRKIVEILLSLWLNNQFSKKEIIKLYIAGVRFETGIQGLAKAMRHFFGELKVGNTSISNEEAFFLVERLSNVASKADWLRIMTILKRVNVEIDIAVLKGIYEQQVKAGRISWV